jgi:hypothetical protein
MNLTYKGKSLTGTICNDGPMSSGKTHAVIQGEMQCKSGMNFGSRYLHVKALEKATFTQLLALTECSKCQAELTKKQEEREATKAGA